MSRQEEIIENQGMEPIDLTVILHDFFRILRRKWLYLVLLAVVLAAGLTMWRTWKYVPQYVASATYAITAYEDGTSNSYQNNAVARQLAETSPHILTSDVFRRRVAEALDVEYVPSGIQATAMEDTNFLTISVTDTDPQRANETLRVVQQVYPEVAEYVIGKIYMEVMDESGVPSAPSNPLRHKADILEGALLGFLIDAVIVAVLAFTKGTVRREEDCVKRINTKCLGTVPRIQQKVRSKQTEQHLNILQKNANPELTEAFRGIRNKIGHRAGRKGCQTLLVTSALPGEGKSTIAVNTALSLVQSGKKVVLVDCDLRNPSDHAVLGLPEGSGMMEFLEGTADLRQCLVHGKELFGYEAPFIFLRGGKAVADGSGYLSTEKMHQLMEVLKKDADYVILDTPPAGLLTDAGILAQYADGIVFVVKKDFAKVDKILEAMGHVSEGSAELLGCVLNDDA